MLRKFTHGFEPKTLRRNIQIGTIMQIYVTLTHDGSKKIRFINSFFFNRFIIIETAFLKPFFFSDKYKKNKAKFCI
jgi:hypothetical protein